jgi:AcrR family transcriptional regulator
MLYDMETFGMSRLNEAPLAERQADFTRRLLLQAAVDLVEEKIDPHNRTRVSGAEVTLRAVARRANISERTVFRYFPSRDEFFDALAEEVRARIEAPPPPRTMAELEAAPRAHYGALEARPRLVLAALDMEDLNGRIRPRQLKPRWSAISKLIDDFAPERSELDRRIAVANINYHLSATAWRFYRFHFGLSFEESVACADTAIGNTLAGLKRRR